MTNPMLDRIRKGLGRTQSAHIAPRPEIVPSRVPGTTEQEIELFLEELSKLSASGEKLTIEHIPVSLTALVEKFQVKKACLWRTPLIENLSLASRLTELGVELVAPAADKHALAECDLGITEVAYGLPETGTIVLVGSDSMPRATSLLPRVHLAIATPACLRADLVEVLEDAKQNNYFVFISGPSRTADIEMTPALGVHGPRELVVWMLDGPTNDRSGG